MLSQDLFKVLTNDMRVHPQVMQIASGSEEYRNRMLIEICRLRNLKQEYEQVRILEIGGEALRRYLPHQVCINLIEVLSSQKELILSLSEKLYICAQALTEKATKPTNQKPLMSREEFLDTFSRRHRANKEVLEKLIGEPLMSREEFLSKNSKVKEVLEKLGLLGNTADKVASVYATSKKVAQKIRSSKPGSVKKPKTKGKK